MGGRIIRWKAAHPDLAEFILFNVMSNVATAVNFIVLWLGNSWWFRPWYGLPFHWFLFDYSDVGRTGGLCGFLSFLSAYVCAQAVNLIVQKRVVFHSDTEIGRILPWYLVTVCAAGLVSVWLPPHVIGRIQVYTGKMAVTIANMVNIAVQVMINYPMMKFVVMKDSETDCLEEDL